VGAEPGQRAPPVLFHAPRCDVALPAPHSQPTIAKGTRWPSARLNLALGCDLIVASDEAPLLEIFARRGLSDRLGGSYLWPRTDRAAQAKELAFFADIISARRPKRWDS